MWEAPELLMINGIWAEGRMRFIRRGANIECSFRLDRLNSIAAYDDHKAPDRLDPACNSPIQYIPGSVRTVYSRTNGEKALYVSTFCRVQAYIHLLSNHPTKYHYYLAL